MPPLAYNYAREIRTHLRRFANWQPGEPRQLGDYGELDGSLFVYWGNIRDEGLGIDFDVRHDESPGPIEYRSAGAVTVDSGVGASADLGPVAKISAGLTVKFDRASAILLNAAGVQFDGIADLAKLEADLISKYERKSWKGNWVVVTSVARAASTTVLISQGNDASIELTAGGDVPQIDLADASLKLGVSREHNIGYKAVTKGDMVPVMALGQVKPKGLFWWRKPALRVNLGFGGEGETAPDEPPPQFVDQLGAEVGLLETEADSKDYDYSEAFGFEELE